ncbi:RHS repeat-associated core domain-containing protein, partial [Candidatus Margulisiibacteriota bacterium]
KSETEKPAEEKVEALSIGIPDQPEVFGSRYNPSSTFSNAPGDSVDPGSGSLTIKQTDILLPGKAGLDLEIARAYNNKGFRSNPAPNSFGNTNEIWDIWTWGYIKGKAKMTQREYAEQKARDEFNFRIPLLSDQWGGWMGKGWQSSIGGELVASYSNANHPHSFVQYSDTGGINWSEKLCPDPFDAIRITIAGRTYVFNNDLQPKDKGQREALKRTANGYVLIDKTGRKYRFEERLYCKLQKYKHHQAPLDHFEFRSEVYHLSAIEDPNGNKIQFIYDKFGATFQDREEDESKWTITVLGAKWAEVPYYNYERELAYVKFLRPSKIIDSFGREINIHYQSSDPDDIRASMIDRLTYKDSNGSLVSYQYVYDANNCLKDVIPPQGNPTRFIYKKVNQNLDGEYDDEGYLLAGLTYSTGGTVNYSYDWYNPGDYDSILIKSKQEALSSYLVSRRAVNNQHTWHYSYGGGNLYSRYGEVVKSDEEYKEDKGEAWNFGRVTVSDPIGETELEFEAGLVKREVNAEGHSASYAWDYDTKNLLSMTLNKGGTTIKTEYQNYDDHGNPRKTKEYGDTSDPSDDREVHFEYMHDKSSVYKDKHIVDRISHAWMEGKGGRINEVYSEYDAGGKGNLIAKREVLDSGTAITSYRYDSFGNLTGLTDPNHHTTSYSYASGSPSPTKISHLLTLTNSYYFNTGLPKTDSDYNGNLTSYAYDKLGRLTAKTNPDGSTQTYTYYDSSNRIEVKDENNNISTYRYDNLGRLIEVNQPEGSTIRYEYDPLSRITMVSGSGKTTRYAYDKIGRLANVTYADGSGVSCDHLDSQSAIEVTDGEGNATKYKYDGLGRLTEVIEADNTRTSYSYTADGKISTVTDARGLTTTYTYDRQGGLIRIKYSDGTINSFKYDPVGNLTLKTNAKDQSARYSHDAINRIKHISYADQAFDVFYTYDEGANGKGKLTSMRDRSGRAAFSYDRRGRLTSKDQSIGSVTATTYYSYDNRGNILFRKDPVGSHKTYYSYDGLSRVRDVKRDTKNGQRTVATYSYDPDSTIREIRFLNGTRMAYTYDRRNRVDTIRLTDRTGKEMLKHDYDYDNVGNRTALNVANVESISYDYDNVYRLTDVEYSHSDGGSLFQYDPVGNRTRFKYPYGDIQYFYESRSNQLDYLKLNQHGKIEYSFDANGNLIKEEYYKGPEVTSTANYTYDPEDRLLQINYPYISVPNVDAPLIPDTVISMVYDGDGKRVKKTAADGTTLYHYDLINNVLCETDEGGQAKAYYIYANGQRICRVDPQGKMFFYHNDALGSPALITDEDGEVRQRYLFEPFGSILASKGKENDNNYTFTGKEYDRDSGLFYYGARYYDPKIGRFITKDVAAPDHENPQTLNRYVYCMNNPLKYVDPAGLKALKAVLYALRNLGGRPYGENWKNSSQLVCNEYVYFAYRKGEGINGFPRSRIARGTGQIDWFRKRMEFIAANEGAASRAEVGDLVYFGGRASFGGHVEMIIATRVREGAKEVALAGARSAANQYAVDGSGPFVRTDGNKLLWVNLADEKAVAKYFYKNKFRGIGQYKGTDYSAAEETSLLGQIEVGIGTYLGGYPGGGMEVRVDVIRF